MIVIFLFVSLVIFVFNGGKFAKYIPKTMSKVILVIIGVIFIMLYIFAGMLLDKSSNKVYDFFVGSLIANLIPSILLGLGLKYKRIKGKKS